MEPPLFIKMYAPFNSAFLLPGVDPIDRLEHVQNGGGFIALFEMSKD